MLSPGNYDDAATNTSCTTTSPSVDRLKGAYERASMALAADGLPHVLSNESSSWDRKPDSPEAAQSSLVFSALGQCSRMQEKVLRDISMLRQDVLASKTKPES